MNRSRGSGGFPAGKWFAVLAAVVFCSFASLTASSIRRAYAEQLVRCGEPVQGQFAAAETDAFSYFAVAGSALSVEATDTSRSIGLIRIRAASLQPPPDSCAGDLEFISTGGGTLEVSNSCGAGNPGTYTVVYNVVSAASDNCGKPLPCGSALTDSLNVPGEVDSFTFAGIQGDRVSVAVNDVNHTLGTVRLRVFDPTGVQVTSDPSCTSAVQITLPRNGTYTALVSTCFGPRTGPYTITWQPPRCPAQGRLGQYAYVGNADDGNVSVVDLSTNTTRALVPVVPDGRPEIGTPIDVAITPNGGFAFVTYANSSAMSVINTSTNLVTASVPVGPDAMGVAIAPDGNTAYVTSQSLGGIVAVDARKNQVQEFLPLTQMPDSIVITPDGASLYVVAEDLEGIAVVHTAQTDQIATVIPVTFGLYNALAVSPNGALVYAGSANGIVVIDTTTLTGITTILTGDAGEPFSIAFTPDGASAYVTLPDDNPSPLVFGSVWVIDTRTHTASAKIPAGFDAGGVAVSADGTLTYVTDFSAAATDPGFNVIDNATGRFVSASPTLGDGPSTVAITTSPTGLCVGDANGETVVTVDEIITAINYSLDQCPGRFPSMMMPVP